MATPLEYLESVLSGLAEIQKEGEDRLEEIREELEQADDLVYDMLATLRRGDEPCCIGAAAGAPDHAPGCANYGK